jgi:hypothetical protein
MSVPVIDTDTVLDQLPHDDDIVVACPKCGCEDFNVVIVPTSGQLKITKLECQECDTDLLVNNGLLA